jgi:hypothetical protein
LLTAWNQPPLFIEGLKPTQLHVDPVWKLENSLRKHRCRRHLNNGQNDSPQDDWFSTFWGVPDIQVKTPNNNSHPRFSNRRVPPAAD